MARGLVLVVRPDRRCVARGQRALAFLSERLPLGVLRPELVLLDAFVLHEPAVPAGRPADTAPA